MSDIASTVDSEAKLANTSAISPIKEAPAFQINRVNQRQPGNTGNTPGTVVTDFTLRRVEEQCHACHKYRHQ